MSSAVRGCHINEPVTQCCCTVFYLLECVVAVPPWLFAVFLDVPINVSAKGKYLKFHMEIFVTWIKFIAI